MPKQYPREFREQAVRLVAEHRGEYETEYAAIRSIAAKLGIATPESRRKRRGARKTKLRGYRRHDAAVSGYRGVRAATGTFRGTAGVTVLGW